MHAMRCTGRRHWLALALLVAMPLPAAAQELQDCLLRDAGNDNSRLRRVYGQPAARVQMRRASVNASPAARGYWVPRHVPRADAASSSSPP